ANVPGDARLLRNVLEGAVAPVAIERVREPLEMLGVTVDANVSLPVAAEAIVIRRPLGVVHHDEVKPAVVVIVEPAGGHGPLVALDAGLLGRVFEATVPKVVVQDVPVNAGHKQISVAVIVIVGGGAAHRVTGAR